MAKGDTTQAAEGLQQVGATSKLGRIIQSVQCLTVDKELGPFWDICFSSVFTKER